MQPTMIVMEPLKYVKETARVVHVQRILIVMEIPSARLTILVVSIYMFYCMRFLLPRREYEN